MSQFLTIFNFCVAVFGMVVSLIAGNFSAAGAWGFGLVQTGHILYLLSRTRKAGR